MFSGDEQNVFKPFGGEVLCFAHDLFDGEGDPEDGIVSGEAAIRAVIDAFIGEVEGREEPHGFAKVLAGQGG